VNPRPLLEQRSSLSEEEDRGIYHKIGQLSIGKRVYKRAIFRYDKAMKFSLFADTHDQWDNQLLDHKHEEFLQSYEWGEFQAQEGRVVIRIQGEENGKMAYHAQGFVHTLSLGMKYVYFPHNPPLPNAEEFLDFLKQKGFIFARFEPMEDFEVNDFKKVATHHRQYQYTSVLNLRKSDEDLLKSFHEKTRYNIRLAAKKGVHVVEEKNPDIFWPLLQETYKRDNIKSHSEKYYRDFIDLPNCHQLTAYFNETPLASLLLITFGKTSVYVHGASSNQNRNLMAPYLLQWEAMQFVCSLGANHYDLGGVAKPISADSSQAETFFTYTWDKTDKLSGVTRFKAGFNGTIKHYGPAFDVVFDSWKYAVYQLAKKFL